MAFVQRIDQVLPVLAGRDAIGQHTLGLREVIRAMGLQSDIYYADASPDVLRQGIPVERIGDRESAGRLLIYQLSIGSRVGDVFAHRPEAKLVDYHNITPADLIDMWEPAIAAELRWGREQMRAMASDCLYALADSAFNAAELSADGYSRSAVAPLLIDFDALGTQPDPRTRGRLQKLAKKGGADWLFVGKVAPHKAQHDLVKAFVVYRAAYDPKARLHVVGGSISESYTHAVQTLVRDFDVEGAVEFTGSVTRNELAAYYSCADVFVCLSDHEGFCVPLVEAMAQQVPVVAYGAAAVPDTVGEAAVLLPSKDPALVATAVHRVLSDEMLRRSLAEASDRRVEQLALPAARSVVTELMTDIVNLVESGVGA